MSKLVTLQATYRLVTPLFLGGVNPNECAELRPPSFKGVLRFWYRAIDPKPTSEASLFGSTDEGQSKFLLHVSGPSQGKQEWKPGYYDGFNEGGNPEKNGLRYLSFSLKLKPNDRKALSPGRDIITLRLHFKQSPSGKERCQILAALWLLGHIGGLGTRSRRGFGTLALKDLEVVEGSKNDWSELEQLVPAHSTTTADDWLNRFESGLATLGKWFTPVHTPITHTVLGSDTRFYLFREGCETEKKTWQERNGQRRTETYESWETALNAAGRTLQNFRQRRTISDVSSDYERVKAYLSDKKKNPLPGAPTRVVFGLPLTFRYNSLEGKQTTFQGKEHDRSASPLFIRIVEINGKCYPFFALLDAPLLAPGEEIKEQNGGKKGPTWPQPSRAILNEFCRNELLLKAIKEVRWSAILPP